MNAVRTESSSFTVQLNFPHKSQWGHHPCDRVTFGILKELQRLIWEELTMMYQWCRWNRKEEQNQGKEPDKPRFFFTCNDIFKEGMSRTFFFFGKNEEGVRERVQFFLKFGGWRATPEAMQILDMYNRARVPKEKEEDVEHFTEEEWAAFFKASEFFEI